MPLYNPYIEESFLPVEEDKLPSFKELLNFGKLAKSWLPKPSETRPPEEGEGGSTLGEIFKKLHLDDLETGDILLLVILIYLMIEGDDKLELAITLGVLFVLWLAEKKEEPTPP